MFEKAVSHNLIYREKNLTNEYTIEEICEKISNGSFDDLFVGDYFDIEISTEFTEKEIVRCVFAGFDLFYGKGDAPLRSHHAVIVPKNCFTKPFAVEPYDNYFKALTESTLY